MIEETYPGQEDLYTYFVRPPFQPVRYRHVKRGTTYTVVSDNEFSMSTISAEGSLHDFIHEGRLVQCELQFSGGAADESGRISRYGGPLVVYYGEDGKYWMRPCFEFFDGRFEKIEGNTE